MWRIDGPIEFWDGCNIEEHICVARRLHRAIRHNKIDTLYALQEISLSFSISLSSRVFPSWGLRRRDRLRCRLCIRLLLLPSRPQQADPNLITFTVQRAARDGGRLLKSHLEASAAQHRDHKEEIMQTARRTNFTQYSTSHRPGASLGHTEPRSASVRVIVLGNPAPLQPAKNQKAANKRFRHAWWRTVQSALRHAVQGSGHRSDSVFFIPEITNYCTELLHLARCKNISAL